MNSICYVLWVPEGDCDVPIVTMLAVVTTVTAVVTPRPFGTWTTVSVVTPKPFGTWTTI